VLAAALSPVSVSALAAEPSAADKETGRSLYVAGMGRLDVHDYAGAERACRGAHAIVQVPTAATCLARALEGLGRLVEARDMFLEAAHYPVAQGEPKVFTEARSAASAEADALAGRIPSVTLAVTGPPDATLRATVDGAVLQAATVRLPRKVDPGKHIVEVSAPGYRPAHVEVVIAEGQQQSIPIALEASATSPTGPAALAHAEAEPGSNASSSRRTIAFVVGGVGVAGVVVGSVFGAVAGAKWSRARTDCGVSCAPGSTPQAERSAALTDAAISTVGLVAGGVLLAGAIALYVTGPSGTSVGTGIQLAPMIGASGDGLLLRGAF
jgi:hypothetical protein